MTYVDANTPIGGRSSVQLITEKGKEEFYIKMDFNLFHMSFVVPGCHRRIRFLISYAEAKRNNIVRLAIGFSRMDIELADGMQAFVEILEKFHQEYFSSK